MPRLVTGVFYERDEAQRAVEALRAEGITPESIYLETELEPGGSVGRKGGEVSRLETERRIAGLETGAIIGLALGLIGGYGFGSLSSGIGEWAQFNGAGFHPILMNPWMTAAIGALLGMLTGGVVGWVVDYTLDRLGAGPARPMQETLVTVRTDEAHADNVYAALFRARARHLHVAEMTAL